MRRDRRRCVRELAAWIAGIERIHPARSRVEKLARERPASLVAFDLLLEPDGGLLASLPLAERRKRLEKFAKKHFPKKGALRLSPATDRIEEARKWFKEVGADLDGIIAKRLESLPEMQRKVLALYYFEDLRLREIADVFGVTESRISQIHAAAILSIKSFLNKHDTIQT